MEAIKYNTEHGSPWDRGSADSYYGRPSIPHWYPMGSYRGTIVEECDMTAEEVEAYHAGYEHNEKYGDKKNWD
jgi:hypothetical protein